MGSIDSAVRQGLVFAVAALVVAGAALAVSGWAAALWCAALGAFALVYYHAILWYRHRQVRTLALDIDKVLHGSRDVAFVDCRESDISMLGSELAKMVSRLQRTTDELTVQKSALSDALADVSHQIRTLLTTMALMLPALESETDPQRRKLHARQLEDLLNRVSWLVTTLLKIAKADAGAIRITKRETTPKAVALRAVQPLMTQLDLHDVDLELALDEGPVQLDELWTAEALENIVKNCMEHTPAGGTIRLRTENDALSCQFVVTDTGPGIAEGDLHRIFDRFYSGPAVEPAEGEKAVGGPGPDGPGERGAGPSFGTQSAHKPAGFGIGLSLALSLVSMQGGAIQAENAPEGGARFTMSFPKIVV